MKNKKTNSILLIYKTNKESMIYDHEISQFQMSLTIIPKEVMTNIAIYAELSGINLKFSILQDTS